MARETYRDPPLFQRANDLEAEDPLEVVECDALVLGVDRRRSIAANNDLEAGAARVERALKDAHLRCGAGDDDLLDARLVKDSREPGPFERPSSRP